MTSGTHRQRGFTAVETTLVVVSVLLMAGVGYFVFTNRDKNQDSAITQTEDTAVPAAPAVDDAAGLDEAESALDQADLDATASDSSDLDSQASGF